MARRPRGSLGADASSPRDDPDARTAGQLVENEWITKINKWRNTQNLKKWRESCERIRNVYRYENSVGAKRRKYALLWSNTQLMRGVTYAKPPKADVKRRWNDKDDTARITAIMLERCINFTLDTEAYDQVFQKVRDDFLLEARGVARVRYEPVMEEVELDDDGLDGAAMRGQAEEAEDVAKDSDDEGRELGEEVLAFERVPIDYVHPDDFVTDPARTWEEVKVVCFRSFLTREQLEARFGEEVGGQVVLDAGKEDRFGRQRAPYQDEPAEPQASVWEIWDKSANLVRWVSPGYRDVLEEDTPHLKFKDFFPCPKPCYGTLTSDTLSPRADYVFYQDQAEEINNLTARIASLQDSLKIVGFYPGGPKGEGVPEVERAVTPGVENKMIAVMGWDNFMTKGGNKPPVVFLPVQEVAQVLKECVELRKQLIDDVNQIYGIADIMRGDSDAQETATAQQIKGNFGSLRIRERQQELARFCRDVTRLVGEVVCNHFQPETIMSMANMPLPTDQALMQMQLEQMLQQRLLAQRAAMAALPPPGGMSAPGGPPMGMGGLPSPGARPQPMVAS